MIRSFFNLARYLAVCWCSCREEESPRITRLAALGPNSFLFPQAAHSQKLVLTPLSVLLSLFPGPQKLIQKRYDKLLDYNSYLQRAPGEESDLAKKEYEALNAQLVEELQVFNQAACKILLNCLCGFITLLRDLTLVKQQLYSTMVPVSTASTPGYLGLGSVGGNVRAKQPCP